MEPPQGRQRAARVAESGTLGGGRERPAVTVVPYEDLKRSHEAGLPGPDPRAAFQDVARRCFDEHGYQPPDEALLSDPQGSVLAQGGFVLLAVSGRNREPVGCAALRRRAGADAPGGEEAPPSTWHLEALSVLPASRRQGAGRLLVDTLLRQYEECAGENDRVYVEVPAAFEAAKPFLSRMGFQEEGGGAPGQMLYCGAHVPRGAGRAWAPAT